MMEGISYIFASEVPMVLVDVMRGGPGLGNIAPSQADYFQVVKGGGHGDYHPLVLAPATVQEAIDLTYESFDLAEKYRTVVVILLDGCIGQMMEPAELPPMRALANQPAPTWALRGKGDRERKNIITSIYLVPEVEEEYNRKLQRKLADIRRNEVRYREYFTDDAEYLVVGFGTSGRVALTAVKQARARGMKVGLLRPISLYPFPAQRLEELAHQVKNMLVVEMNAGQMIEDVRLSVNGRVPVRFYGRMGGMVPLPDEVLKEIREMVSVGEETKHFHLGIQNELGEWSAINDLEVEEEWR
jgi:2-oxoglutarate ferredoxin oxidoreductase subunit alpha